ncbi:GntR family transcriptional regulator [Escherichia coli]|nr:GntR family transcriptional regulator [Escherichia coli]GDW95497.1 transcriptional repressor [Escherichia coli]
MGHKPLYRQIADRIREQITCGELKPGDALPTESALQTEFGVSRVTVRQALRQLVEQQILESIQGSGTYVKEERVNYDIFQLTSFDEKLSDRHVETHSEVLIFEVIPADNFLQQQLQISEQDDEKLSDRHVETHSEVLIFEVIPADNFLQQQLQISEQDRVWHVKRVRYRKQKPVALEETWMPLALFPDLTWQVMENSKYHFIEEVKKMVIDRSEQEIIPLMPTEEMSRLLNISQTKPILEKVSRGYLVDGQVFEYSRNAFNTDDYKFTLIAQRKSPR